jgi:glycosyltransferase involved in cell wall biosynthesis
LEYLQLLATELGIAEAIEFTGGIYGADNVASRLAALDVLVNPSLRAWSETFCIANIEAMAMSLPVVTFGVGGIGQYTDLEGVAAMHPSPTANDDSPPGIEPASLTTPLFSETKTGAVVNTASPEAIADAIIALLKKGPEARSRVGQHNRDIVLERFTLDAQIQRYDRLYEELFNSRGAFPAASLI